MTKWSGAKFTVWQTAIHLGTDHCSGSLGTVCLKYRNTSKWCISLIWGIQIILSVLCNDHNKLKENKQNVITQIKYITKTSYIMLLKSCLYATIVTTQSNLQSFCRYWCKFKKDNFLSISCMFSKRLVGLTKYIFFKWVAIKSTKQRWWKIKPKGKLFPPKY